VAAKQVAKVEQLGFQLLGIVWPKDLGNLGPGKRGYELVSQEVFSGCKYITREKRDIGFACFAQIFGSLFDGWKKYGDLQKGELLCDFLFPPSQGFECDPLIDLGVKFMENLGFPIAFRFLNHALPRLLRIGTGEAEFIVSHKGRQNSK